MSSSQRACPVSHVAEAIVKFFENAAQLRWLLPVPEVRGQESGGSLWKGSGFLLRCRILVCLSLDGKYTFGSRKALSIGGFRKTEELTHEMWGCMVTSVRYELALK